MKNKYAAVVTTAVIVFVSACGVGKKTAASTDGNGKLLMDGPLWASLYMQHAAEYKALTMQAYNIATERLNGYVTQPTNKPFAVITDIDETVLDNSPNAVHDALNGATYTDSSWITWTKKVDCDTVPGAPAFFKYAASKKVEVYYISNRLAVELPQTIANLQKYNMPNADAAHILLKTTTSSKDVRRAQVAEKYNVLMWFGDNLGDFEGVFDKKSTADRAALVQQKTAQFGNRFIVLPNAVYGEWMNALIKYNYKLTNKEKADTLISTLKNY